MMKGAYPFQVAEPDDLLCEKLHELEQFLESMPISNPSILASVKKMPPHTCPWSDPCGAIPGTELLVRAAATRCGIQIRFIEPHGSLIMGSNARASLYIVHCQSGTVYSYGKFREEAMDIFAQGYHEHGACHWPNDASQCTLFPEKKG